jgi:hypothetical protein
MSKVFHEKLSELTQILFYYFPYQILQTFRKMSPEDQPIDGFVAEILRQNDIALLLKKSTEIYISYVTSAMIKHFCVIKERHSNFTCRILFVTAGRADDRTLSDFLKDFQTLGLMLLNVHTHPIDFKYVVKTPDRHVPDVSNNSSFATERKVLVIMLLSIITFGDLNTPEGVFRVSCLELIAALQGSLETHYLRIISDLASSEDIRIFETKARQTRIWHDASV